MASLKALMPKLAPVLGTTPTSLYERQRVLVGAGLLEQTMGKGPGSGVHMNPQSVATLVLSVMATDGLTDAAERTATTILMRIINDKKCGLTGARTLHGVLSELLEQQVLLDRVGEIVVSRSTNRALFLYKPHGKSKFGSEASEVDSMQVSATLTGRQIRRIWKLMGSTRWASLAKKVRDASDER